MFSIHCGIVKIPLDSFLERMFAHGAICYLTELAADRQTWISVDKDLYREFARLVDELLDLVYLIMGLLQRIVPGQRDMAIYMQGAAVLDLAHIMYIYPLRFATCIEISHNRNDYAGISLIHDAT